MVFLHICVKFFKPDPKKERILDSVLICITYLKSYDRKTRNALEIPVGLEDIIMSLSFLRRATKTPAFLLKQSFSICQEQQSLHIK